MQRRTLPLSLSLSPLLSSPPHHAHRDAATPPSSSAWWSRRGGPGGPAMCRETGSPPLSRIVPVWRWSLTISLSLSSPLLSRVRRGAYLQYIILYYIIWFSTI